ncbi:hypothetical protein [uncultured Algibacter sp.]|uniref:hypothetical protein n=1 Tax=uncultured Algibacter sp. TaxID=298659 RepID=UPI002631514C|nr:hypothetical protein [uncultured Algibacter sp.]
MSLYPEHILVKKCLQLIEDELQWGDSNTWHNKTFIELSEKIREETSILLSVTTLKRVWGRVKYNSTPSISTLNTLALFAGFNTWRDFKTNHETTKNRVWFEKKMNANSYIIIVLAIIFALGFISIYSMIDSSKTKPKHDFSNIKFSSKPVTNSFPNSVIFDFNLDNIKSDSIYIQQYWDVTKTIKIKSDQKQATGIYYYPGYYNSKLRVDGKIIRRHDLFIKSEGWVGTIDYKPTPKYLSEKQIKNDKMGFSEAILNEIKKSGKPLESTFHYIDDFGNISGDNIKISQSVKSVLNDKWAVCQNFKIVVLGTEGAIIMPFSKLGCVSNLDILLSNNVYSGKEHDLSAFGVDLNENKAIDISIKDKTVNVFVDNRKIYENTYHKSIGKFVGLRYRFLGAGQINTIKIEDLNKNAKVLECFFSNDN